MNPLYTGDNLMLVIYSTAGYTLSPNLAIADGNWTWAGTMSYTQTA
jgi:hypothetical protein